MKHLNHTQLLKLIKKREDTHTFIPSGQVYLFVDKKGRRTHIFETKDFDDAKFWKGYKEALKNE